MSLIEDNMLRIGFSLGALFDMKEAEEVYEKEGLEAYLEYLQDLSDNGETFAPGPALGTYVALRNLKNKIPSEVLDIRFGIVSKNADDDDSDLFKKTYRKLISDIYPESEMSVDFDYLSFTDGGLPMEVMHKAHKTDLSFTTSKESAENNYKSGIPSIYIPNTSKEINAIRYAKKDGKFILVADYDGVISDVHSEMVYQKAKKMKNEYGMEIDPIEEFRKSEREKRDIPMELGPMGKVLQKLGRADYYFKKQYGINKKDMPFQQIVVTARGVAAYDRYKITLKKHKIDVAQVHMMDGTNKNNVLEALAEHYHNENLLFIDDGEIHFERSLKLKDVVSGLVMNDFNTGRLKIELNNDDKLRVKDFLDNKKQEQEEVQENNSRPRMKK